MCVYILQELLLEPEEAVDGLTLLDLDAVLQERLEKLQQTKAERQETLRNLQEKDEVRACVLVFGEVVVVCVEVYEAGGMKCGDAYM